MDSDSITILPDPEDHGNLSQFTTNEFEVICGVAIPLFKSSKSLSTKSKNEEKFHQVMKECKAMEECLLKSTNKMENYLDSREDCDNEDESPNFDAKFDFVSIDKDIVKDLNIMHDYIREIPSCDAFSLQMKFLELESSLNSSLNRMRDTYKKCECYLQQLSEDFYEPNRGQKKRCEYCQTKSMCVEEENEEGYAVVLEKPEVKSISLESDMSLWRSIVEHLSEQLNENKLKIAELQLKISEKESEIEILNNNLCSCRKEKEKNSFLKLSLSEVVKNMTEFVATIENETDRKSLEHQTEEESIQNSDDYDADLIVELKRCLHKIQDYIQQRKLPSPRSENVLNCNELPQQSLWTNLTHSDLSSHKELKEKIQQLESTNEEQRKKILEALDHMKESTKSLFEPDQMNERKEALKRIETLDEVLNEQKILNQDLMEKLENTQRELEEMKTARSAAEEELESVNQVAQALEKELYDRELGNASTQTMKQDFKECKKVRRNSKSFVKIETPIGCPYCSYIVPFEKLQEMEDHASCCPQKPDPF